MKPNTGKINSLGMLMVILLFLYGGSGQVFAADNSPELPIIFEDAAGNGLQTATSNRVEGSWWDGLVQYTTVTNYLGYAEYGFGTWVGYWQNVELGHPKVNELY